MNDSYHRLWILLQSKIARMSNDKVITKEKRETLYELMKVMALLEADVILGD